MSDIIVVADTQVTPDSCTKHIQKLAEYIWSVKPKHVVHIGDNWDFPSLSYYASKKEAEGNRLVDDLKAGADALAIIPDYINKMNKSGKRKPYKPKLHFIKGNHEVRLDRMIDSNPHLEGLIDLKGIITAQGWSHHEFLYPKWIEDIAFNHFMPNPMSGKPIGGGIENKLNKHPHSFVHGHVQQYQYGRRQSLDGRPHFGVCAGSFYSHNESYRGSCNTEIRGFVHMRGFTNRYNFKDHDVEFVSLERLMEMK